MSRHDPRMDAPVENEREEGDEPARDAAEILKRVDSRSLQVHQAVKRLEDETAQNTTALGSVLGEVGRFQTRIGALEARIGAIEETLPGKIAGAVAEALTPAQKKLDHRLTRIEEAADHLREKLDEILGDHESSKRFILSEKARKTRNKKFRNRIILACAVGFAGALGTFAAGAAWSSCVTAAAHGRVEPPAVEVH
jgi:chromosome segregation ATPase